MIDIKTALGIIETKNPEMRVYTCNELSNYYVFSLIPKDLKEGDGYGSSRVYMIDKNSGEYTTVHFSHVMNEPIIKEIDINEL